MKSQPSSAGLRPDCQQRRHHPELGPRAAQQAIAAYQLGAESGLLQKPVLELVVQFQGHHKQHADVLAKAVQRLGGKPVAPLKDYAFPKEKLKAQADLLTLAASLEKGAVSAYLGAAPIFTDREVAMATSRLRQTRQIALAVERICPVPSLTTLIRIRWIEARWMMSGDMTSAGIDFV
jgi:hypothetical protein